MGKAELTLEIDADLLHRAREAGLNPSDLLEDALRRQLPQGGMQDRARDWSGAEPGRRDTPEARAAKWAEENAQAISDHQRSIEAYGVFGEDLRRW